MNESSYQQRPTKRAPDAGDSAATSSSFSRLSLFLVGRLRRPRPSAGNANRWALRGKPNARANTNSMFCESVRKLTVMENEISANSDFNIENCRAENVVRSWVDCLSLQQASFCGFSVKEGNGYSCEHPRRFAIVEITKKLKDKSISPQNILGFYNQE